MPETAPLYLAPSQALSLALAALTDLSDWIANTADTASPPDPIPPSIALRRVSRKLRGAAEILDDAARRAQPVQPHPSKTLLDR